MALMLSINLGQFVVLALPPIERTANRFACIPVGPHGSPWGLTVLKDPMSGRGRRFKASVQVAGNHVAGRQFGDLRNNR